MWPLLLFSVAAVAITIERAVYFIFHNLRIDDLETTVTGFIKQKDFQGAIEYLSGLTKRRMGARIFLALISNSKSGKDFSADNAERAAETEGANCINSLENTFNFLTALGSLSPLTGFLGTVTGMIAAFRAIAEAAEVNAQIVAGGIYEALITTVFGLIVAIIAMISHSVFSHIVDRFTAKIEIACSKLIILIAEHSAPEQKKKT